MDKLSDQFGLCIKTLDQKVITQNESCQKTCGDMIGKICDKGCMHHQTATKSPSENLSEGMTLIKNSVVDDNIVDAVVINDGKTLTTIIYSLEGKIKNLTSQVEQLKSFGLTKSEMSIFTMVMKGAKNLEICKTLFISKPTLKTHLNNIYKKLPISWHHYKKRS